MSFEEKKTFLVNTAFTVTVAGLVIVISKFMLSYLLPFLIGIALSYLMQKPARKISEKLKIKDKSGICAAVLVVTVYVAVVTAAVFISVIAVTRISGFLEASNEYLQKASDFFTALLKYKNKIFIMFPAVSGADGMLTSALNDLGNSLIKILSDFVTGIVKNLPDFLLGSVVTVVASCYIAKDYDRLVVFICNMLKSETVKKINTVKEIIVGSILKIISGYLILMVITFAELTVGFYILGIKYPVAVAAVTAVVDLFPVLGTGTVLLPWALISFVSGKAAKGVGIIVIYSFVTLARNFLEPKIIGESVGVYPLLTLITVFVGIRISGISGMIILPLTVIVIINYYKRQIDEEKCIEQKG